MLSRRFRAVRGHRGLASIRRPWARRASHAGAVGVQSEAMRIVRTIGQAFEVCHQQATKNEEGSSHPSVATSAVSGNQASHVKPTAPEEQNQPTAAAGSCASDAIFDRRCAPLSLSVSSSVPLLGLARVFRVAEAVACGCCLPFRRRCRADAAAAAAAAARRPASSEISNSRGRSPRRLRACFSRSTMAVVGW